MIMFLDRMQSGLQINCYLHNIASAELSQHKCSANSFYGDIKNCTRNKLQNRTENNSKVITGELRQKRKQHVTGELSRLCHVKHENLKKKTFFTSFWGIWSVLSDSENAFRIIQAQQQTKIRQHMWPIETKQNRYNSCFLANERPKSAHIHFMCRQKVLDFIVLSVVASTATLFSCNHSNLVSFVRIFCSRGEEIGRRTTKIVFLLLPPHFFITYWDRFAFDRMHANIR